MLEIVLKIVPLLFMICVSCSQPTSIERLDGSHIEEKNTDKQNK